MASRLIPTTGLGATAATKENDTRDKDPFVVTPPRKHSSDQYTASTTPATPKSKSTPLHKRFLDEVTMNPGTSSTPPLTPTRSPKRGVREAQQPKQTLEVGQNGFYFSIDIPEKKITPRRAGTPDTKPSGRLTPSPDKSKRGEVKTGGRVRDILKKNLFGTPAKQTVQSAKDNQDTPKVQKFEKDKKMVSCPSGEVLPSGNQTDESEGALEDGRKEPAIGYTAMTIAAKNSLTSAQSPTASSSPAVTPKIRQAAMPSARCQTPQALPSVPAPTSNVPGLPKTSAASTPSNMGHLIANHSNKGSRVQALPSSAGLESMPTPLRKMSEKLGLRSPHVVRRDQVAQVKDSATIVTCREKTLRSPISALDLRTAATSMGGSTAHAATGKEEVAYASATILRGHTMRDENRLRQMLPSPITTVFPVVPTRPSSATTPSLSSPSTPSRPGLTSRAKSFGTPSRLRSSIKEDMFKVQESLRRSLGPEAFQPHGSRPTTPMSPMTAPEESSPCSTNRARGSPIKSARPMSMAVAPQSDKRNITQAVPRRVLDTAARKPRPKSMIVGSAKMLETVASQIDSPRERAKLRSAAAAPTARHNGPTTSRPGTAAATSRGTTHTATKQPTKKPDGTIRTTKSAAPRTATISKRAAPTVPVAHLGPPKQRTASAEIIASQISNWRKADQAPITAQAPVRRKTTKAPSAPISHRSRSRAVKTPEPKDRKADSGTAQSYTPPGNPTRLPSPVKAVTKPRPAAGNAPLVTPTEAKPAQTPSARRLGVEIDVNAVRTPSKDIQSSLDAAIDRKIREDRERRAAGWF